ncbi:MAG: DUF2961 domain-containing protein [Bacteroidota bacterium]
MKKNFPAIISILLAATALYISIDSRKSDKKEEILPQTLYEFTGRSEIRWVSFENMTGAKGEGGKENFGAKGHACDAVKVGESKTILDLDGSGIINRIWMTIGNRTLEMLRGLVINIYWDHEEKPAVSAPFGDFFGVGHGKTAVYENALFANPQGKSFNSFIPMPFKTHAMIELVNESEIEQSLIF